MLGPSFSPSMTSTPGPMRSHASRSRRRPNRSFRTFWRSTARRHVLARQRGLRARRRGRRRRGEPRGAMAHHIAPHVELQASSEDVAQATFLSSRFIFAATLLLWRRLHGGTRARRGRLRRATCAKRGRPTMASASARGRLRTQPDMPEAPAQASRFGKARAERLDRAARGLCRTDRRSVRGQRRGARDRRRAAAGRDPSDRAQEHRAAATGRPRHRPPVSRPVPHRSGTEARQRRAGPAPARGRPADRRRGAAEAAEADAEGMEHHVSKATLKAFERLSRRPRRAGGRPTLTERRRRLRGAGADRRYATPRDRPCQ